MFPFLVILHHYAEFDIHTIIILEKLLGVRSFGGFINHYFIVMPFFLLLWVGWASLL
jgi:hypothetical protein